MKIAIIGRGSVAQALGSALGGAHEVRFGVRAPGGENEQAMPDAAAWADAVILATPWSAEASVAEAIAEQVTGKPVIDATNPVGMRDGRLDLVNEGPSSAAEALQTRLPAAHVVKCFNQIGAEFMERPSDLDRAPVMFAASDDDGAKAAALTLARDAGFEAVDGGPLANARHLESFAMLWIWSALKGPLGRSFGFALTHRKD